jgi:hypothetical protein
VFRQLFFPESQSFAGNTMPGARNLLKCFTGTHLQTATPVTSALYATLRLYDSVVLERAVRISNQIRQFIGSTATKLLLVRPIKGLRRQKVRVRIGHKRDGATMQNRLLRLIRNLSLVLASVLLLMETPGEIRVQITARRSTIGRALPRFTPGVPASTLWPTISETSQYLRRATLASRMFRQEVPTA